MKILCKINDKPAVVVSYAPGPKGRPLAIVICEGKMRAVKLKDIQLNDVPEQIRASIKPVKGEAL